MKRPAGGRQTLRFRLLLITSSLTLVALIIFGAVSFFVLRHNLIDQAEETLELANESATTQLAAKLDLTGELPGTDDFVPVPPTDGFFAVLSGGRSLLSAYLSSEYEYRELTAHEASELWAHRGVAETGSTVELGELGSFVVTVSELPDANGAPLLVMSGISLAKAKEVSITYALAISGLGVAIAVASALVGSRMVRRQLLPLERVVDVADRVSRTPLDSGEVPHQGRVPRDPRQIDSEADRVAGALNRLLSHVETSLNTRHQTEESMRRFVAEASHELRNPLASIRGYADFYSGAFTEHANDALPAQTASTHAEEAGRGDKEARGALRRIGAEAERMSVLVDDLLTLARLDADHSLQSEEVELSRVMVETFADARVAHKDHSFRIFVPDEPIVVCGDEHAIRQMLLNLVGNAAMHTPPGTEVRLELEHHEDGVVVTVSDNGPGIPAELLPRIFDRFSQGGRDTRARNSVGLGLAIVRALCDAAGYGLEVASTAIADTPPAETHSVEHGTRLSITILATSPPA